MRKRSEVVLRKRSEAKDHEKSPEPEAKPEAKPAAAVRTIPLFPPDAVVTCDGCSKVIALADTTARPGDGIRECGNCGQAIDPNAAWKSPETEAPKAEAEAAARAAAARSRIHDEPTRPPKSYCPECGTEWLLANGRIFPGCGHSGEAVDHPSKSRRINPPAGHPQHNVPPQQPKAAPLMSEAASPTTTVTKTEQGFFIRSVWNKATFRIDDYGVNITIGPFELSSSVHAEKDIEAAQDKHLVLLKRIADRAFDAQVDWYAVRLGMLAAKMK